MECFLHETDRGRRDYFGEEPSEAHPLTVALRTATNLEHLMRENGTIPGHFVGEDEVLRGLRGGRARPSSGARTGRLAHEPKLGFVIPWISAGGSSRGARRGTLVGSHRPVGAGRWLRASRPTP